MPLSPLDINNKEFTRGFRGYAEDEVNEFLDQVIKDYEIILREKKELEDQVKSMSERMNHYNSLEEIRIRVQKPIILKFSNLEKIIRYKITREEILNILQLSLIFQFEISHVRFLQL